MVPVKKLDRYLLKSFLLALVVVTVAVGLTINVINIIEELRDFIDNDVPVASIAEYYLYFGGWVVKSFLPMFVLIASLFSVSMFARRNEILAMKASGISLYRIALPYLAAAAALSVGHFYYNEYVYPPANQRRLEIKEFTIEKRSRQATSQVGNIYRQIEPGHIYTIEGFNVDRRAGLSVRVYRTADDRLRKIITAERLTYDNQTWVLHDGVERTFSDSLGETYREFADLPYPDIREKPEDFAKKIGDPADMGLVELRGYIDLMKRTGGPYHREEVDLGFKYAYPVASFIVVLISLPLASNPRRGGVAVSISAGALISLVYFVTFRVLQSAGYNQKIPLEVSVWGVNALFFLVGVVLMLRARK
ncbi:MAG TPA: LptF/LptG family permease [candidate division Zixibacteria bacterium]|nr:LptF/LptG family permease [candidate division Zixibacteria bacterium]MDD4917715.1 LptF/LptG family permease [candidate division Zixibacteria bacterium]MDM7973349.1 LptF/LptG family permease [candidate division Zixibacteria bacterium]HOD67082.1 LptF/LptG family permease [candidate division Zixibacteria bacterium]HOZ06946.1 LptF/LptG family permease [candidate division Zixibacteria bacterium]